MSKRDRIIVALLALAILTGLVVMLWQPVMTGLSRLWSPIPTPMSVGSPLLTPTASSSPTPTPTPDMWPFPTSTPWVTILWPTFTPQPTPTRRPGPTATPFPLRGPAADAAGTILYQADVMMALPVDEQGRPVAEPQPLPLSPDLSWMLGPASPDGRYLIVIRPVEPAGIPYVFDMDTHQAWPLLRGHPRQQYIIGRPIAWHPDARQLLFWMENNEELWLVDAETGQYTVLALSARGPDGAAISPDGQRVVYVNRSFAHNTMMVVSAAGGDARPLLDMGAISQVYGWSPDGAHILCYGGGTSISYSDLMAGTPSPGGPLRLVDPQGQHVRYLQGPYGTPMIAAWSPDGQWVATTGLDPDHSFCGDCDFLTSHFQGRGIYIENVYSGEIRRLASGVDPVWSPDGSMLAFLSIQSGAIEVWTVRIDSSGLQQLTSDGYNRLQIVWVPARR